MEIRNLEPEAPRGDSDLMGRLEAHEVAGDSVSRVYAPLVDATVGTVDTMGLVTAFVVEPIPEPSTLWLGALATAFFGLYLCEWYRTKSGVLAKRDLPDTGDLRQGVNLLRGGDGLAEGAPGSGLLNPSTSLAAQQVGWVVWGAQLQPQKLSEQHSIKYIELCPTQLVCRQS